MITRRTFLTTSLALSAFPLVVRPQPAAENPVFRHGVASGDPLRDRVILWTRITPPPVGAGQIDVEWMVARDPRMTRVVGRGNARTFAARDFTVKVDARGLDPATTYYYRFASRGERSPIGRTRTLPERATARLRLGLASCANHPFGFFNAYARLAARADLDAVLHLGDYIYEYANNSYGNRPEGDGRPLGRVPRPDRELLALDDYRARYAQYREDPDLQEVHRQHPFIVIWDDHELANDAWRDGAINHNPESGEGDWTVRRAVAERAWREWIPVRDDGSAETRIYRSFRFGDLAHLSMLDTRLVGRDRPIARVQDVAEAELTSRHLLGVAQERWLFEQLADGTKSGVPWQLLGQQVMFSPQSRGNDPVGHADSWDGYRGARNRLFDAIEAGGGKNLVVLTGDVHSSWAYDIVRDPFETRTYDPTTGRGSLGVEIVAPAVTSPNRFGQSEEERAKFIQQMTSQRPHLRFIETFHRGYTTVDLTRERLQVDWWFVPTITKRTTDERCGKSLASEAGRPHLVDATSPVAADVGEAPAP